MISIHIKALFLNFIIYLIMLIPLILISLNKKIYSTKKDFFSSLIYCTILEIVLSAILYIFSNNIFSIFTNTTGIVNFAVYSSKILFISSSLYALKILIPTYLYNQNKKKKLAIFIFSKTAITIFTVTLFYIIFNTKGALFAFPICDFIFYIIYILEIIR